MSELRGRLRAFTLIELLVVVAIIALLLSILLPSLNRAKEQARIAVCISNLKQLTSAAVNYINEGNDEIVFSFPFDYNIDGTPVNFGLITEFIWGGGVPDKTAQDYTSARVQPTAFNPYSSSADIILVRPKDRPLNRFLAPGVSWDDASRRHPNPLRTSRKMDLPGFFKCPSDKTPHVPLAGTPSTVKEAETPFSTWEFWGTSYASNWYWPYYYVSAPPGNAAPYSGNFGFIVGGIGTGPNRTRSLGRHIMKDKSARWSAEFIVFYENRMNYAMNNARPRGAPAPNAQKDFVGWHQQRDYHAAGFLDGSARYQKFDTRYVDGPGWTTWPNKPWQGGWAQFNDD